MLLRNYLQQYYGLPRRRIISLIDKGKVFLNNKKVESYKSECHENDILSIGDLIIHENVSFNNIEKFPKFLAFNKPKGYTCSRADPHNPTFYDLLPQVFRKKYYYIGRLDKNSHGLVLLTTDPKLVHDFEHPSKKIIKDYLVILDKPFNWGLKTKILTGIYEGGELLKAESIKRAQNGKILVSLNEGKKRHIRRIFDALGYKVIDLQRISIGKYLLGDLEEGAYKILEGIS